MLWYKVKYHEYSYPNYADLIDEILEPLYTMVKVLKLIVLDINTALGILIPDRDFKRYKELGGEIITIGLMLIYQTILPIILKLLKLLNNLGYRYYTNFKAEGHYGETCIRVTGLLLDFLV